MKRFGVRDHAGQFLRKFTTSLQATSAMLFRATDAVPPRHHLSGSHWSNDRGPAYRPP